MHFQFTLAADLIAALDIRAWAYAESFGRRERSADGSPGQLLPRPRPRDHGPHQRQHNTANPI